MKSFECFTELIAWQKARVLRTHISNIAEKFPL